VNAGDWKGDGVNGITYPSSTGTITNCLLLQYSAINSGNGTISTEVGQEEYGTRCVVDMWLQGEGAPETGTQTKKAQ
jgi:hypothetical protein